MEHLCEEFQKETGVDLTRDRMAMQRIKEASEKAKHELSSTTETEINLPFITADDSGPKHLSLTMTRDTLEDLTRELIKRSLTLVVKRSRTPVSVLRISMRYFSWVV